MTILDTMPTLPHAAPRCRFCDHDAQESGLFELLTTPVGVPAQVQLVRCPNGHSFLLAGGESA